MNYERQEQAFDPIANREREDERADYISDTWDAMAPPRFSRRTDKLSRADADIDRIQAERDERVGRATPITRLRPLRATIDAAWMAGTLTGRMVKRYLFPHMAACDAEEQMADRFETRPSRIQISRITLSEGWTK